MNIIIINIIINSIDRQRTDMNWFEQPGMTELPDLCVTSAYHYVSINIGLASISDGHRCVAQH